ncbi:hypothetical protein PS624_05329 [Pseudomonas fluorescens]|uniref:Uncharacterized protein n=1 Tax=Pseudomonas fluorescens TaxID=294 RepID=A0A5E6XG67_PSEFL|nr:hypothetical protein PS624_05329 [Pseudomonas fluorescens]
MGVLRQIIEQGRGFVEEQRQVVLDAGRGNPAAQILKDRAATEVDVETLAEARLEAGHRVFLQRKLAGRQQLDRLDLVNGALVFRIEGAQGFDLIVEQVDAIRQFAAHREQVDQRAAYGELAVLIDRVDVAIATGFEARTHLFNVELLADIQYQTAAEQELGRRQAMQCRGNRHHQHAVGQLRQPI